MTPVGKYGEAGPLSVASHEGIVPNAPRRHALTLASAIFVGIGIPLLASSPTVTGIALALGLILLLAAPGRLQLVADLAHGARTPLGLATALTFILWLPGVVENRSVRQDENRTVSRAAERREQEDHVSAEYGGHGGDKEHRRPLSND